MRVHAEGLTSEQDRVWLVYLWLGHAGALLRACWCGLEEREKALDWEFLEAWDMG